MKKVIVLGFGSMGKLYCNRIVGGFISEMQLYGIVCRNIQKHPDVYSYGVKVYDSFDQAIQEKECFDAVIITCPHKSHIDYITKAIQNGLEVLCEKPISDSLEEALSLLNQPTELNTKISMIFNWRKRKSIIEIKKRLDILGRINHIVWIANFWYRTDFYHKSSPWRSTWEKEGGGLLINQAQHLIDVWCYLFGLPDRVYANVEYGKWNSISVDDSFEAFFSYEDGKRGILVSSTIESPGSNHLEIHGENGKMVLDGDYLSIFSNEESSISYSATAKSISGLKNEKTTFEVKDSPNSEYDKILTSFAEGKHDASLQDGINALRVVAGIYLSSSKNKEIPLPDDGKEFEDFKMSMCIGENRFEKG